MTKMYKLIFISIIAMFFSRCGSKEFPDKIESQITNEHFRLKGTRLFVVKPKSFTYYEDVNLFKYNDSVFIHCLYIPGNFRQTLNLTKNDFLYNKDNYEIVTQKGFTINSDTGIYTILKTNNKMTWCYFQFGSTIAGNEIIGCYPECSSFQDTIFDFVKHCYYKNDFIFSPMENAKFKIDIDGSGFNFTTYSMNQFIFYEDSAKKYFRTTGLANHLSISQFSVIKNDSVEIKKIVTTMNDQMKNAGIIFDKTILEKEYRLNNNYAYKLILKGSYLDNKNIYVYELSTGNSKAKLFFCATLYHDGLNLTPTIEKVANTLKIL